LVETGTGDGCSLDGTLRAWDFKALYSCDIDPKILAISKKLFADHAKVHIEHAASADFLRHLLPTLPLDAPILFWLDAHFPGCYSGAQLSAEPDMNLRFPLEEELEIIAATRPLGQDVITCDDLRLYVDGPYGHGPLIARELETCPEVRNIDFVYDIMGETHHIATSVKDDGYIILTPRRPK